MGNVRKIGTESWGGVHTLHIRLCWTEVIDEGRIHPDPHNNTDEKILHIHYYIHPSLCTLAPHEIGLFPELVELPQNKKQPGTAVNGR